MLNNFRERTKTAITIFRIAHFRFAPLLIQTDMRQIFFRFHTKAQKKVKHELIVANPSVYLVSS